MEPPPEAGTAGPASRRAAADRFAANVLPIIASLTTAAASPPPSRIANAPSRRSGFARARFRRRIADATLSAARLALRSQTGLSGQRISASPKYSRAAGAGDDGGEAARPRSPRRRQPSQSLFSPSSKWRANDVRRAPAGPRPSRSPLPMRSISYARARDARRAAADADCQRRSNTTIYICRSIF